MNFLKNYFKLHKKRMVPRTKEEFDEVVRLLTETFPLSDSKHTEAVVAQRLQHLPVDQGFYTLNHLGNCVLRNMTFFLCQSISQNMAHEAQIRDLESLLTVDPLNQQARDALEKAAKEGSPFARDALERIFPKEFVSLLSIRLPTPSSSLVDRAPGA